MAEIPVARVGDAGSHGGAIITGAEHIIVNGKPLARVGDLYGCPRHGPNMIVSGAPFVFAPGTEVAHVGSKTACGALIVEGSPNTFLSAGQGSQDVSFDDFNSEAGPVTGPEPSPKDQEPK